MTAKFNRDTVLKHTFFDVRLAERAKQLQGWLSNVVTAAEPKTEAEALQALMQQHRKPFEPIVGKVSLHSVHGTFFGNREQHNRPSIDESEQNKKKPGPG